MMKKIIIPIKGMHCKSCEMLIEDKLSRISGVKESKINHKTGSAEIYYGAAKPKGAEIEEAISSAGYAIGEEKKPGWINKNPGDYKDLGIAFVFLLGIYFVLKSFGLTNISISGAGEDPESFGVVLLVGLTAGFSSCMALVGGLVLGASTKFAEKHPGASALEKFKPHIFFNLGRIIGFAALGGALGALGSIFQFSSFSLGILTILVGLVMLVMGLQLINIFPRLSNIKIALPKAVSRALGIKGDSGYSHKGAALLGAFTFFLPCGFTQAMQLFAVSTGNFLVGALVMGIFAIGTAPGLLGIGGLTSIVKGVFAKRFFKLAGILVIIFAFFNFTSGWNLTGISIGSSDERTNANAETSDPNVSLEDGIQIVRMAEVANGYEPNIFTIKKGVPVKWIIDAKAPYSCASSLVLPKQNIRKQLKAGENIIEFTPTEIGALKFSCSMGMYTGVFNVIDDKK
ncbi:MAG: sulfite exporter TauE/SafE family protein [Patescibacteria group bacterium]|jgi:sulfite exporter TauE/SafE/copper chaperone CopZ